MARIDPAHLSALSRQLSLPVEIRWIARTTSTNDVVRTWAREGAAHGSALVAEEQTAGRGRLGREWRGVPGGSVLLSLLVRPRIEVQRAPLLALAAAVGVATALGTAARIKWPNDVLDANGLKLAGILAELDSSEPVVAVLGVGVNVQQAPDLPTAGTLVRAGESVDRARLAVLLVHHVLAAIATLESSPAVLLDQWRARAAYLGAEVSVAGRRGRMRDVDGDGALLLDGPEGVMRILAGDVSLITGP